MHWRVSRATTTFWAGYNKPKPEKDLENELKKHHKDAYMWACQCCSYDMEEGKEVLQLTYLKIAEGKAVYRQKSSFKTLLLTEHQQLLQSTVVMETDC